MKTCGQCNRIVGDLDTACKNCGQQLPLVGSGAHVPSASGISWQPLTPGGVVTGSNRPPLPSTTPTSPAGTRIPVSAGNTGYNIPQPSGTQVPTASSVYNTTQPVSPRPAAQPGNAGGFWPNQLPAAPAPQRSTPFPGATPHAAAAFQASSVAAGGTDMKPVIPRTDTGIINRAQQMGDQIYGWMEAFCRTHNVAPRLLRSNTYDSSVWLECFAWVPEDPSRTSTDRWFLNVTMQTMPFHRFEILCTVTISVGEYRKVYTGVYALDQGTINQVMTALMGNDLSQVKKIKLTRVRELDWQLWRQKNKVTAIDEDWFEPVSVLSTLGFLSLAAIAVFPIVLVLCIACFAGAFLISYLRNRKRWQYRNQGKPLQEPRLLHPLDSWHSLILEIGPETSSVRQEVFAELRKGGSSGFAVEPETIWYLGPDGKEEREQVVARFRRGIVFIHTYSYGGDMYVGWDAHINAGTWVEKEVAKGRSNGQMVSLRTVVYGRQNYSEYDLYDTNCLLEWVHAIVTRVVRRKMAHYKIDQEVDFKIIRAERKLDAPDSPTSSKHGGSGGGIKSLFKRKD